MWYNTEMPSPALNAAFTIQSRVGHIDPSMFRYPAKLLSRAARH